MMKTYDAVDARPVRRWLTATATRIEVTEGSPVEAHERYLDTPDWRFHRAGLVLHIRSTAAGVCAVTEPRRTTPARHALIGATEALVEARIDLLADCPGRVGERVRALATSKLLACLVELHS
jgi:hypothetical protein